jgi:hypothetical protein
MYNLSPLEKELATFSDRVEIISGLVIGKKLEIEVAYQEIKSSMKRLKKLRKEIRKGSLNE